MKLSSALRLKIENNPTKTYLREHNAEISAQYDSLPKSHPFRKDLKVPDTFDGRKVWNDFLTPVLNQKKCGSCWAIASTSVLSDRFNIHSRNKINHLALSPTKLILCDYKGGEILTNNTENNAEALKKGACYGNTLYDAWRYLYVIGSVIMECIPFDLAKQNYSNISDFETTTKLPLCATISGKIGDMCANVSYDEVTGEENGDVAKFYRAYHVYAIAGSEKDIYMDNDKEMKGSEYNIRHDIYSMGPVSTGMEVYPDFYTFDAKNEIYEWNGIGEKIGGHAVEIVGWGVDKSSTKNLYWIIKNSWGEEWGRGGYFYMIRGKNNCKLEENCIAGLPDFFYSIHDKDAFAKHQKTWIESDEATQQSHSLAQNYSSKGGGVDRTNGYSRRAIITKPWLKLTQDFKKDDIANKSSYNNFVAGLIISRKGKQTKQVLFNYNNHKVIIVLIVLIVCCGIVYSNIYCMN